MNTHVQILRQLLGLLKAQNVIYQDAHWEVTGPNFYGNHLLFERLYKSVLDQIDTLAEKMVTMYGPKAVQADVISKLSLQWIIRWSKASDLHQRGLQSESDFQELSDMAYAILDESDGLSMGMDDFLMATANAHETNQYLLTQSQRT